MRSDDDEDTRQTKNEAKEDQGDGRGGSICESRLETESN